MYEFYFDGRKPSIKQVMAKVNEGIRQGSKLIEVSWGENMITLQRIGYNEHWHGSGWIKGISGYDIAIELNKKHEQKFIRDHFAVYHIGA